MFSFVPTAPIVANHRRSAILSPQTPPFQIAGRLYKRSKHHYRAAPTCLRSASGKQPKASVSPLSIALFLSAMFWALVVLPIMLLLHPFLLILRLTRLHISLLHFWMRMTLRTSFMPISTSGLPNAPKSASLIVSNLQSPLDMFIMSFLHRPFLLMVPERAKRAPIVGWMLRLAGVIFVSPDRRGQMQALIACTGALKKGYSVAVFPEGVPHLDGVIASFPSPIFAAARKASVPIVPVTINGSFRVFDTGVATIRRPSKPIYLTVHQPVDSDSDDRETAQRVRRVIRNQLPSELRGEP